MGLRAFRWKRCFSSTLFSIFFYHVICWRIYIPRHSTYIHANANKFFFSVLSFRARSRKKWRDNRGATSRTTVHIHIRNTAKEHKKMYHERYFVVIIIVKMGFEAQTMTQFPVANRTLTQKHILGDRKCYLGNRKYCIIKSIARHY